MQLARPVSNVIFDLDGVLLDTERLYTEATQQIVGRYGKRFDWSIKVNMMGRASIDSARYLVNRLVLPISAESYLEQREVILSRLFPNCEPMPGAIELVRALHACSVPLAVASSTKRSMFELKIERHRAWFSLFDTIVLADDSRLKAAKPAPDIFLIAASDLNAEPSRCLVVEDSPAGVAAGKAAGMQVLAVPYPGMDPELLRRADIVIDSLTQLTPRELGFMDS
ncbi:MAG: HAD-IA family hydrolase [Deltaproteobacteria bacterium]|nr:HAD-IA family hydrolase [Deltaproteobacteria bacterium]